MRAALYARVSTDEQGEEERYSIPEQIRRIEAYAERKGYTITRHYVDIGASGTASKRPELQRMLGDAASGQFKVIMALNVDRLARGIRPFVDIFDVTEPAGISLEFVNETYDGTPVGEAMFQMRIVFGKMERDLMIERTKMGKQGRAKTGRYKGGCPPFGYRYNRETGFLEIDQDEARIVKLIFQWYLEDVKVDEIVLRLNASGVPTKLKSQNGWGRHSVYRIINTTYYHGEAYQKGIPIHCPPIIDKETFARAQAKKKVNSFFSPRKTKAFFLLQRLLYCEQCGHMMASHSESYNRRGPYRCYRCTSHRNFPHLYQNCREMGCINAKKIEPLVWGELVKILRNPDLIARGIAHKVAQIEAESETAMRTLKEVQSNMLQTQREKQRVISLASKGLITEEELTSQLEVLRAQEDTLLEESRGLERTLADKERRRNTQDLVMGFIETISNKLDFLSLPDDQIPDEKRQEIQKEKQKIARLMIDRVWVNGDGRVRIEVAIPLVDQIVEDTTIFRLPRPRPNQPKNDRCLTFTIETSLPRGRRTRKTQAVEARGAKSGSPFISQERRTHEG